MLPPEDLSVLILVPFALYATPMLDCESMKVSAIVTNKLDPEQTYLAKYNVVLVNPPISVTVSIFVRKTSMLSQLRGYYTVGLVHIGGRSTAKLFNLAPPMKTTVQEKLAILNENSTLNTSSSHVGRKFVRIY